MLCSRCYRFNDDSASSCQNCGGPLRLQAASSLSGLTQNLGRHAPDPRRTSAPLQGPAANSMSAQAGAMETGVAEASGALNLNGLTRAEKMALSNPVPQQIEQSASFVFLSDQIQQNKEYAKRIKSTSFRFDAEDDSVNAYATNHEYQLTTGEEVPPPAIIFLGGLARTLRVASAALAVHHEIGRPDVEGSGLTETFRCIGDVARDKGNFGADSGEDIFTRVVVPRLLKLENRVLATARSFCAAMESFVIAHEAGHLAYSHPMGPRLSLDISRNKERDADSFASSVMISNPYREYLFLGGVAVTMVFCWFEAGSHAREATTHPLARERFENLFHSAPGAAVETAASLGLTQQAFEEMLPAA